MNKTQFNTRTAWRVFSESSVCTPGFHRKRELRQRLPENPYSMRVIEGSSPLALTYNGYQTERDARGHDSFTGACHAGTLSNMTGSAVSVGYKLNDHIGEVSNRLLSKVRNCEIDLGVALGEYRETASFVAGAMVKTAKSYKQLRRGDVSGALQTLTGKRNRHWADIPGAASNTWLAYSYGLRPLVNDVADAVRILDKGLRDPNKPVVVRSSSTQRVHGLVTDTNYGYFHDIVDGSVRVSGKVEFWISNPTLYTLEQVGFVNPLSVAWELVPFSFVVDWFIPIGDYLTNVIPPQGVSFVSGSIAYRGDGTHMGWTTNPYGWYTSMEQRETFKGRKPLTSFPRYSFKVPDLSLSKSKISSGLALLWQQLRK